MTYNQPQHTKILIVDDDSFVRDMLEMILDAQGYMVETAVDGKDALEKYSAMLDINLIVSDMNMPEMNGLELIRGIRGINEDVPIIILTGNNEITVAIEAIHSGAYDYLIKDENIQDTILLSVNKVLEKYYLKQKNLELMDTLARQNSELEKSNQELLALNQLKNKFLGIAAHDLRNPLSSIGGISEIILTEAMDKDTDEQREFLSIINTASNDMLALVNDLLDVSVIESGKLELQLKKGSLKKLIDERIRVDQIVSERKNITIHQVLSDVPDVLFDPNRLAQVIDNLLGNAIKFSPQNSNIYVSLDLDSDMAKVSVRDEGPGIPAEEQSKLFGEFQRLSVQPTDGEKSTGLGLAIVKKIVEAHKGVLEVQSQTGKGSTFSFSIPLSQ